MNKFEVLEQVYPDEISLIFEREKEQEIKRLQGYITQMYAFAAGDGPKEWFRKITEKYNRLVGAPDGHEETKEDPYDKLRKLQGTIAQNKRRGGGS